MPRVIISYYRIFLKFLIFIYTSSEESGVAQDFGEYCDYMVVFSGALMYNKRKLGEEYENFASEYLLKKGYMIRDRNVHEHRFGELDIVAEDKGTLVFIEVKFRTSYLYGDPMEAVGFKKRKRIIKSAMSYMKRKGISFNTECRFDCIGIIFTGSTPKLTHVENAFFA